MPAASGRVVASKHPGFAVGDDVAGSFGVQEYAVSDGKGVRKVDPSLAPLPTLPRRARHAGHDRVLRAARHRQAEAGRHGGGVRRRGRGRQRRRADREDQGLPRRSASRAARTSAAISSTSSGFDAAIDYKARGRARTALREHCPKGIDVYFDNVGGEILDAALARLALHARIVICGAISQYNNTAPPKGPANYLSLLVNRASMTGMVVFDYADRYNEGGDADGAVDRGGQAQGARGRGRGRHRRPSPRRSSSSSRARTSASSCCRPMFEGQAESRQTFS